MLQPKFNGLSAAARDANPTLNTLAAAFNTLTLCSKHSHLRPQLPLAFVRYASHAAQGRANGPKDSAGRRLGAKKTASQYVIPGNIIFKQRGTKWFPGENVSIGKDHTIYATEYGYVRYYRNPTQHPKRRYIGVALEKEGAGSKLPTPLNAPTRRRLGMYASPIKEQSDDEFLSGHLSSNSKGLTGTIILDNNNGSSSSSSSSSNAEDVTPTPTPAPAGTTRTPQLQPGTFWPTNYDIGKLAEKSAEKVRGFDRKDRWLAWRKRSKKVKEKMLARAAKSTRKTKGKKTNKGAPLLRK